MSSCPDRNVCYGHRNLSGGGFYNLGAETNWWSSSVSGGYAWYHGLNTSYTSVHRTAHSRSNGFSVRCVRNLRNTDKMQGIGRLQCSV
ncbi:MAG: hypothetical protein OSJ36_09525 [Odoribacter sp.]|nr:hypothetical protein [Odoribacter sp.]